MLGIRTVSAALVAPGTAGRRPGRPGPRSQNRTSASCGSNSGIGHMRRTCERVRCSSRAKYSDSPSGRSGFGLIWERRNVGSTTDRGLGRATLSSACDRVHRPDRHRQPVLRYDVRRRACCDRPVPAAARRLWAGGGLRRRRRRVARLRAAPGLRAVRRPHRSLLERRVRRPRDQPLLGAVVGRGPGRGCGVGADRRRADRPRYPRAVARRHAVTRGRSHRPVLGLRPARGAGSDRRHHRAAGGGADPVAWPWLSNRFQRAADPSDHRDESGAGGSAPVSEPARRSRRPPASTAFRARSGSIAPPAR